MLAPGVVPENVRVSPACVAPVAPAGLAKMSLMNLLAPTRKLRTLLEPIVVV